MARPCRHRSGLGAGGVIPPQRLARPGRQGAAYRGARADGERINRLLFTTLGGSVRAGEPLLELVPSDNALTVEASVKPEDIAFVRKGQRALVKITAYDYSVYGGLEGKVSDISPDATVEERSGEAHYTVRVSVDAKALRGADGAALPIGPGMVADVNLIGDRRSIMRYLLTFTRLSGEAFRER
jgi:adhesin transport system membrane fusion protein